MSLSPERPTSRKMISTRTLMLLFALLAAAALFIFTRESSESRAMSGDLIQASKEGQTSLVKTLVGKGARVDSMDDLGSTPLLYAAQFGHMEIVRVLLENGADPNVRDYDGITPAIIASFAGRLEMVKLLLAHGADLDVQDVAGKTALEWAGVKGYSGVAEFLRRAGHAE